MYSITVGERDIAGIINIDNTTFLVAEIGTKDLPGECRTSLEIYLISKEEFEGLLEIFQYYKSNGLFRLKSCLARDKCFLSTAKESCICIFLLEDIG